MIPDASVIYPNMAGTKAPAKKLHGVIDPADSSRLLFIDFPSDVRLARGILTGPSDWFQDPITLAFGSVGPMNRVHYRKWISSSNYWLNKLGDFGNQDSVVALHWCNSYQWTSNINGRSTLVVSGCDWTQRDIRACVQLHLPKGVDLIVAKFLNCAPVFEYVGRS